MLGGLKLKERIAMLFLWGRREACVRLSVRIYKGVNQTIKLGWQRSEETSAEDNAQLNWER